MTDLEMTKLCAEAMGLEIIVDAEGQVNISTGYICGGGLYPLYDPLHDDAQAMALVKKFRLRIYDVPEGECTEHWHVAMPASQLGVLHASYEKYLNRAIVECVANMQAMKERA